MTRTEQIIESHGADILKVASDALSAASCSGDISVIWKQYETIAAEAIKGYLRTILPDSVISSPKSKSTYPDIKIENEEGMFAIDIKSNEDAKEPWFDMARLDTIFKEHLDAYKGEWDFIIKYGTSDKAFLKGYFMRFREAVGIREECNGVKFRPYDGKLRPKTWSDFDNNKVYWESEEAFHDAIRRSSIHRWKMLISNTLVPTLSEEQKREFAELFK